MSEELFRVVLTGVLTGEFDEEEAKRRFSKVFKLSGPRLDRLLSGAERVIKTNISEDVAMTFMIRILECGYESYVQEMPDGSLDFDEKRSGSERRQRFRRGPRPGAIVPDRRLKMRRKRDIRLFDEMVTSGTSLPLAFNSYPRHSTT